MSSIVTSDAAEIRREVTRVLGSFATAARNASDASSAAKAESDKAIGARETLATAIAKAAHDGKWNSEDVSAIVADVLKTAYNGGKGALATFAGEIKTVCAPRVRPHVETLFALAAEAWKAEDETLATMTAAGTKRKDIPTPLRREFARKYHMVIAAAKALRDASKEPDAFANTAGFVQWAEARQRAREVDFRKVKARLDAIRQELKNFADDFPVDGLTSAIEFIASIDTADLEACRKPTTTPAPEQQPEPAEGVVSTEQMFGDALADMTGLKEAAD